MRSSKIFILLFLILAGCGEDKYIDVTVPADWPLGEPYRIDIPGGQANIELPTPNATEEFDFIVYTKKAGDTERQVSFEGSLTTGSDLSQTTYRTSNENIPAQEFVLDQFLRNIEKESSLRIDQGSLNRISPKFISSTPPTYASFKVLDNYFDTDSFTRITAERKVLNTTCAIYVDSNTPSPIKNDQAFVSGIESLAANFERITYPLEKIYFGDEPNVDSVPQIIVLFTPVVNSIYTGGLGSVLGFYYSGDLFSSDDYPSSNETEIIYVSIPSSVESIPYYFKYIYNGTLAHELQHMISFNEHVFQMGGRGEEIWLNEGLSHLAEDLTGFGFGNLGRVNLYLSSPQEYALVSEQDGTGSRGAAYLFLRYLVERFDVGNGNVTRALIKTKRTGVSNVENSLSHDFSDLYEDWLTTLSMSGRGITQNPYYNYQPPVTNDETQTLGPFQIGISLRGVNNDSFVLLGPSYEEMRIIRLSMNPTSAAFYKITAQNKYYVNVKIKVSNNSGSGVIVIPTKK